MAERAPSDGLQWGRMSESAHSRCFLQRLVWLHHRHHNHHDYCPHNHDHNSCDCFDDSWRFINGQCCFQHGHSSRRVDWCRSAVDIRFHYDKAGDKDRLGPEQWKWLRETLRAHKHVDLTLIASGVQVLPFREYQEVEESFTPFVRDRLLRLLEEEERSSVVLLSGDVHYTQFFKTPCRSRLGYHLVELCSSGLSHILGKVVPYADLILSEMTPRIYTSTPVEGMKLNFGSIELKREDGDISIKLQS